MSSMYSLWEFLIRDASFFGGPQTPMLSWLGSFGIVLFFLWHLMRLRWDVSSAQRPFERVRPMLTALANERGDIDRERFTSRAIVGFAPPADQAAPSSTRIDCDDLNTLEAAMQNEPMFRQPWAQFRKTLILQHVPWFVEPRIFSQHAPRGRYLYAGHAPEPSRESGLLQPTAFARDWNRIAADVPGLVYRPQ